ncbi:cercosporin toxin biosynthesis protein [Hypoxylon argillaceum]|nr:cercosporin toxin biosynthesis protein [Hypoxylon argillaceum]KAI1153172.1 cercosporin toxin biosynthesis protein [Nemania diffusa]
MSQHLVHGTSNLSLGSGIATKVIIIGAGLGGLTLAQSLRRSGIPFKIFERDASIGARPQGYRIKIHSEASASLRSVLTPELWHRFENTCGKTVLGESNLNALNGSVTASRKWRPGAGDGDIYSVDRSVLRHVLQQGLSDDGSDVISWNKEFLRYELRDDGTVEAHFKDGSSEWGSLLVGADGTRSRVTKQLIPDYSILDVEGLCVYGKTPITPALEAAAPPALLRWIAISRDEPPVIQGIVQGNDTISLLTEPMKFQSAYRQRFPEIPSDYVYWGLIMRRRVVASSDKEMQDVLKVPGKALSLDITSEWHPSVRAILEQQDETYTSAIQILSSRPQVPEWKSEPRVTLLGDAIHVMSPAGGVGACTAIRDGFVLGAQLAEKGVGLESVAAYEQQMRRYATRSLQRSLAGGMKMFNQPPFDQCAEVQI